MADSNTGNQATVARGGLKGVGHFRLRFFPKIVALLLIVAIIPLVAALLVTNFVIRAREVDTARKQLEAVTNNLSTEVTRIAQSMVENVTSFTRLPLVSDRNATAWTPSEVDDLKQIFGMVEGAMSMDLDGNILGSGSDRFEEDWPSRPDFQAAASGAIALSDPHLLPGRSEIFFTVTVPLADGEGQWAVLAVEINARQLTVITDQAQIGQSGFAFLSDADGRFMSNTDLGSLLERWEGTDNLFSLGGLGTKWIDLQGESWLCALNEVTISAQLSRPWQVVGCRPRSGILGSIESSQRVMLWTILGAFALAVASGFVMSRALVNPIRMLARGASRIEGGELDYRVQASTSDEIGDLARSFNSMAAALGEKILELESADLQLRKANDELEANVAERTLDLAKTNEDLTMEIQLRKNTEERISASLSEKEILLKEINHRVKNNLQIISSLLNLQSRDIKDPQALHSFEVSQERIMAMALVHEKLYRSDDLAKIDFGDYIRSLTDDLRQSHGLGSRHLDLQVQAESIFLGVDIAIPCGLIVNELISNSIKHAFPGDRTGEIVVRLSSVGENYIVSVRDDGVGLPQDLDLASTSTLGMTIVNALAGQLEGSVAFHSNGGVEISVTFPAP